MPWQAAMRSFAALRTTEGVLRWTLRGGLIHRSGQGRRGRNDVTPGARVAATIELLDEIVSRPDRPADLLANAFFRARRFIGGGDRRAVSERVWAILRRWGQLWWWLERTKHPALCHAHPARAIVSAELLLVDGLSLGDLEAMFDGGRYRPAPIEEEERRALRQMEGHSLSHPEQPDWVRLNIQEWLVSHLKEAYGAAWGR